MTTNAGPAILYRNDGGTNHSFRVKLIGTRSNRDGIGAVVRITSGEDKQWLMMKSGGAYLSSSELVLTFGLGSSTKVNTVEVVWPSGQQDKLANVDAGQTITVQEGKGIVAVRKFGRASSVKSATVAAMNHRHVGGN